MPKTLNFIASRELCVEGKHHPGQTRAWASALPRGKSACVATWSVHTVAEAEEQARKKDHDHRFSRRPSGHGRPSQDRDEKIAVFKSPKALWVWPAKSSVISGYRQPVERSSHSRPSCSVSPGLAKGRQVTFSFCGLGIPSLPDHGLRNTARLSSGCTLSCSS